MKGKLEWMSIGPTGTKEYVAVSAEMLKIELSAYHLFYGAPAATTHATRIFEYPWAVLNTDLQPTDFVLDAGGGDTPLQFYLANHCKKVVNMDLERHLLERAALLARNIRCENIVFINRDLKQSLFKDNTFDKIFCISTIEHDTQPFLIAKELYRILKPNGTLIVTMDVGAKNLSIDDAKKMTEYYGLEFMPPLDGANPFTKTFIHKVDDIVISVLCLKTVKEE